MKKIFYCFLLLGGYLTSIWLPNPQHNPTAYAQSNASTFLNIEMTRPWKEILSELHLYSNYRLGDVLYEAENINFTNTDAIFQAILNKAISTAYQTTHRLEGDFAIYNDTFILS